MKSLEKNFFSKSLAAGSKMEPSPPQLPPAWLLRGGERFKVVYSCTALLPFSSGLLVQISSLLIGNVLVNESSSVVNHFKSAVALVCRA